MGKKFLNKKRRDSLVAYAYKLSELLVAGIGLAGILQEKPNWVVISWGFVMAVLFFLFGFLMETEQPDDS